MFRLFPAIGIPILLVLIAFAYAGVADNILLQWDDNRFIQDNPRIQALTASNILWMFTGLDLDHWHPLSWLSLAVDYRLGGLDPNYYHFHNVALHGLNAVLVMLLGVKIAKLVRPEWAGGALPWVMGFTAGLWFGLHPQHVESVAWAAERKDVLSLFFMLAGFLAYLAYVEARAQGSAAMRRWYILAVLLHLMAVLAKPMAITVPVLLLILDYYPLKRLQLTLKGDFFGPNRQALLEKIPFFFWSLVSLAMTLLAQVESGAVRQYGIWERVVNALHSAIFYLEKMLWPKGLGPLYPFPESLTALQMLQRHWLEVVLFAAITVAALWLAARGRRMLMAAWGFYLIALLPVIGLVQVSIQAAADRYTYLTTIPWYLLLGFGIAWLGQRGSRAGIGALACLVIGVGGFLLSETRQQVTIWKDDESLWRRAVDVSPDVPLLRGTLAAQYERQAKYQQAAAEYRRIIAQEPTDITYYARLVKLFAAQGEHGKAAEVFARILQKNTDVGVEPRILYIVAGEQYCLGGDYPEARRYAQAAVRTWPNDPAAAQLLKDIESNQCR